MTRWGSVVLAALIAATGFAAAPASAAHSNPRALAALQKVRSLQQGHGVKTGRELTPALRDLFAALPALKGDDRRQAEAMLARPNDTQTDPSGTHKWSGPQSPQSPKCSVHFCVHFTTVGVDQSDGTYAQSMADLFENDVYPCENTTAALACKDAGTAGLGWRQAASDGTRGDDNGKTCTGSPCTDIYIEDLFATEHVFGYVALDPDQPQSPSQPHYAYMVMDSNYGRFGDNTPAAALAAEEVTAAHEYNHVLQDAYDYLEDAWLFESTAVYMEEKVYPGINDYLNYVKAWVANTRQPLTAFADGNLKAYGSAVWSHWLDHRFGPGVIRNTWEQSVGSGSFAPGAYTASIGAAGGGGFSDEFARFSAAVAEWRAPGAGFPDLYPDVPRDGSLPVGNQTQPFALAHTTFAFFDVPIPASAPATIRLTGTLPAGTAGAIALVGRTGADPAAGTVTSNLTPMPTGGTAAVSLDNPAQFGRITAVVVNSDPTKSGFDQVSDDWIFTKDANDVVLTMNEPGPPLPVTGGHGALSDHSAVVNASIDPRLNDTTWSIEYGRSETYGSRTAPQSVAGSTLGSAAVSQALSDLDANATYHYRVVASNASGAAAGADMTFKTSPDVTKPVVSFVVKRQKQGKVRKSGLVYLGRCSERCSGTAQLLVSRRTARKLGLPSVLGKARVRLEARPNSTTLRLRLGRRAAKRLLAPGKSFGVALRIKVADASGNAVAVNRRTSLTGSRG